MSTQFYEIDCDELVFPNLTTINDMPNEILNIINDYKIKLEINDSYTESIKKHRDNVEYNFLGFVNACISTKQLNYNKVEKLRIDPIIDIINANYNYYNEIEWNGWDKKLKHFKTIGDQRKAIFEWASHAYGDYDSIKEEFIDNGITYFLGDSHDFPIIGQSVQDILPDTVGFDAWFYYEKIKNYDDKYNNYAKMIMGRDNWNEVLYPK